MAKLALITLFAFLITPLGGCRESSEKDKDAMGRFVVRARETQFRHKLECEKFKSDLNKEANKDERGFAEIDAVFYSNKLNSCLVAKHIDFLKGKGPMADQENSYEIDDILEGTNLWISQGDHALEQMQRQIEGFR